jgi:hypothetical protein
VESWNREDVSTWLEYAGLGHYEANFRAITGPVRIPHNPDDHVPCRHLPANQSLVQFPVSHSMDSSLKVHLSDNKVTCQRWGFCLFMQRLLQLTQADLLQLVNTKLDAELFADAIDELRSKPVSSARI